MSNENWADSIELDSEDEQGFETRKVNRARKRKWREIENFKEKQRLRRELMEYSQYSM